MIYLSCPYTTSDVNLRAERARKAAAICLEQAKSGVLVFAPIFYGHMMEHKFRDNLPYAYWMLFSKQMLVHSTGLWLLSLPGWRESKGCEAEVRLAVELEIPVSGISGFDGEDVSGREIRRHFGCLDKPPSTFFASITDDNQD